MNLEKVSLKAENTILNAQKVWANSHRW